MSEGAALSCFWVSVLWCSWLVDLVVLMITWLGSLVHSTAGV